MKSLMYSKDKQFNSYYATLDRTKVLEFARDTDKTWRPEGHYVSAKNEASAMEELAGIIMDYLAEYEQKAAYADFVKYALYYEHQTMMGGHTTHHDTVSVHKTECYSIKSRYIPDWCIEVNKEKFSLTGDMDKDAYKLVDNAWTFDQIKRAHPPILLLSTEGYPTIGMRTKKKNNFEECAYFAARKKCDMVDKVYFGFITMDEAHEMSLNDPQMFVEHEIERYRCAARGEVFKETEYRLREKEIGNVKHGVLANALIEAETFLGFYKDIEECLADNQKELGIQIVPDCVMERVRVVGYDEISDLDTTIRYFKDKAKLYMNKSGEYYKDEVKRRMCLNASNEALAIADYLSELHAFRDDYNFASEEITLTVKFLSELKKLWAQKQ